MRLLAALENPRDEDFGSYLPEGPSLVPEEVDGLEGNFKGIRRGETASKKREQEQETGEVRFLFSFKTDDSVIEKTPKTKTAISKGL